MSGYLGTKAVLLSTTAANVVGNATISGDLTVDTDTLYVDSTNNKVGIGTSSPSEELEIASSSPTIRLTDTNDATYGAVSYNVGALFLTSDQTVRFNTVGSERMRIDSSGNLLVGKTAVGLASSGVELREGAASAFTRDDVAIDVNRLTTTGDTVRFRQAGIAVGTISVTGSATAYNTSSDYRLKENIAPVQGAADIVKAMQPVTYTFKSDGSWHDGFLAHELQELHPRAVIGSKDAMMDEEYEVTPAVLDEDGAVVTEAVMGTRSVPDYQCVDYSKLTPILTAALQEALTKIETMEARLAALEAV